MKVGRLPKKSTHKVRMQTYNMDHTKKACVTALPDLVTKSKKYAKSRDFWERLKSLIWSVVLRRNCLRATGFFCQDFDEKA